MTSLTLDLGAYRARNHLSASMVRLRLLDGQAHCEAITTGMPPVQAFLSYSIEEIDWVPTAPPCLDWQKWDSRTRAFVTRAWARLHDIPQAVVADWLEPYRVAGWPPGGEATFVLEDAAASMRLYLASIGVAAEPFSIKTVSLRERTAADEIAGFGGLPAYFARVHAAITRVDGKPVPRREQLGPDADRYLYQPWRGWNWWTNAFVQSAYELMNEPEVDIADFLGRTFRPVTAEAPAPST